MATTLEEQVREQTEQLKQLIQVLDPNNKSGIQYGQRSNGSYDTNQLDTIGNKTPKIEELIGSIKDLEKLIASNRKGNPNVFGPDNNIEYTTKYLTALQKEQESLKALQEEQFKYELEALETSKIRNEGAKKNAGYQSGEMKHNAKLADIEASVRKKYLAGIKAIFKEEEDLRKKGLSEYEKRNELLNRHIKTIKDDVTLSSKKHKGEYSAGKELVNKLVLGPVMEKWIRAFGGKTKNGRKLKRTDSLATTFIGRGGAALFGGADKALKGISTGKMDVSGMAGNLSGKLMSTGNPYAMSAGAVVSILKTAFEMYSKVDKAASDYARKVGGGRLAQDKMRKSAANLAVEMGNMGERTYNAEKILENMAATSEVLGRNLEYLSTQDLKAITDLKDFGISNQTISQFDTFGISLERISQEFSSIYGSAGKKGLNASTVIKSVADNMKLAQNYTFAKGRKAIYDMAEKSAQLKFNLRDAESFANKVGTLEGAMKSAAQLSVLGGSFAMQGNPMTLLYNALNDVEGLQDQMLAMTKGMAYFDYQKGQLEMSAFDRQRLRAMSEATGIDYGELTTQAFNQERVDRITRQIKSGTNKDTAEYIKNIAFLDEKGNARIQFHNAKGEEDGKAKLLSELTEADIARLKGESEAKDRKENGTIGDILNDTRSIQDQLDDIVNQLKNYVVKGIMKIISLFGGMSMESAYGFSEKEQEDYKRYKNLLTSKHLDQNSFIGISEADKKAYQKMGILDNEGKYIGRGDDEKYGRWDVYGEDEVAAMANNVFVSNRSEKRPNEFNDGGYTGDGDPNEYAGFVHKGEYVIDADKTKSMFSEVKNGENPMKFKSFEQRLTDNVKMAQNYTFDKATNGIQSVKVEFGTLHLELGNITKDVDMNEFANVLLSSDSFIQTLIQKLSTTQDYGYRKDDSQFPFFAHSYTNRV